MKRKLWMVRVIVILVFLLSMPVFGSALAQQAHSGDGQTITVPQNPAKNPRLQGKKLSAQWGTSSSIISQIAAYQFVPISSEVTWEWDDSRNMRYKTNVDYPYYFGASPNLPAGAFIEGIELYGCDDSPATGLSGDIYVWLVDCPSGSCTWYGGNVTDGQPGCDWFYYDLSSANLTVDKYNDNYFVEVGLSTADATNEFQAVNVYYRLQVSPAPALATFNDVPTSHPFFKYVEALVDSGITAGCGGGNYCPDNPVTRGQMAVFLSRALGLHWPD